MEGRIHFRAPHNSPQSTTYATLGEG